MASNVLQDPMASSPSIPQQGPRFRPYASPNHSVVKGRYITSNDPRGYIPVYEYPLNGQWIMMDIDDGYILWTGIWKALGNSKADIVKMIDSQPDLAPVIRRVRGGYLKIQGTWMPYEVALRLSRRVAWPIREDLVPLFGPTFPSTCLSPDQPGYGQVVSNGSGRRRSRRNNQVVAPAPPVPRDSQTSWSIPAAGPSAHPSSSAHYLPPGQPASLPSMMYREPSSYAHPQRTSPPLHISSSASPIMRERSVRSRYSPYPASSFLPSRKTSVATSDSVSLDIPSISLQELDHDPRNGKFPGDQIVLPPIQPLAPPRHISSPSYALPPISALEDLRGISTYDSAAVLERLKMKDEYPADARHEVTQWPRQRSISTSHQRAPQSYPPTSWPRHGSGTHRSSLDGPFGAEPQRSYRTPHSPELSLSYHSSHDGSSVDGASPVSPTTPRSAEVPSFKSRHVDQMSPGKRRGYEPSPPDVQRYSHKSAAGFHAEADSRLSACRHSCDDDEAESDSPMRGPLRPW
ncbi:uncharacterized protein EDB91DRAFT_1145035 [Suillus paluster]|uniref:uncharacterized protein n=1 Tax=Suillus paluster TaxID=48578 RepID=UPI001B872710|nr:uncharacterized protein EDB91DRAFT_1145035 [Suillus paluster]KAG1735348.1 hypothetical protein EDB91DRAFT_1145035 [Suillus paluster]